MVKGHLEEEHHSHINHLNSIYLCTHNKTGDFKCRVDEYVIYEDYTMCSIVQKGRRNNILSINHGFDWLFDLFNTR